MKKLIPSRKTNFSECPTSFSPGVRLVFVPGDNTSITKPEEKRVFGLLFDIDGVIVRGKYILPQALECFHKLIDSEGKFKIPTVFVTNAGNATRLQKAQELTNLLGFEITEDQVVMSHSPLIMFPRFHNKQVLICGQGPSVQIARNVGFKKVVTIENMQLALPMLDAVAHTPYAPCTFAQYFPKIEAVVLLGEPIKWESALQLLVDTLMTNGEPTRPPPELKYPHIPLLACNMDLQWMSEAWLPRFGHGAFLICLENLYRKITGRNLQYTALIGKPSEITFHHAHRMVVHHAKKIGIKRGLERLYAIGDNVHTDVYGANLYNHYLSRRRMEPKNSETIIERSIEGFLGFETSKWESDAYSCDSILVRTGVHYEKSNIKLYDHSPRDYLPVEEKLRYPKYIVENAFKAVELIFQMEMDR